MINFKPLVFSKTECEQKYSLNIFIWKTSGWGFLASAKNIWWSARSLDSFSLQFLLSFADMRSRNSSNYVLKSVCLSKLTSDFYPSVVSPSSEIYNSLLAQQQTCHTQEILLWQGAGFSIWRSVHLSASSFPHAICWGVLTKYNIAIMIFFHFRW